MNSRLQFDSGTPLLYLAPGCITGSSMRDTRRRREKARVVSGSADCLESDDIAFFSLSLLYDPLPPLPLHQGHIEIPKKTRWW